LNNQLIICYLDVTGSAVKGLRNLSACSAPDNVFKTVCPFAAGVISETAADVCRRKNGISCAWHFVLLVY